MAKLLLRVTSMTLASRKIPVGRKVSFAPFGVDDNEGLFLALPIEDVDIIDGKAVITLEQLEAVIMLAETGMKLLEQDVANSIRKSKSGDF
ncbi:MAG: hypothetical protein OEX12_06120 [Gammaproteobacteria bacterium]|nr:hypothetical protein [Gammaproteobacteria bacterium]